VDFIEQFNPRANKIASASLTDITCYAIIAGANAPLFSRTA